MTIFIILANFNKEGVNNIKNFPENWKKSQEVAKSIGANLQQYFFTMGRYDMVIIAEAPSAKIALGALIMTGVANQVSTETLTAVSSDDVADLVKSLP